MRKFKLGLAGLALLGITGCGQLVFDEKIGDSEVRYLRNANGLDKAIMTVKRDDSIWTYCDNYQDGTIDWISKTEGKKVFYYFKKESPEQVEIYAKANENYNLLLKKIGQEVSAEMDF